MAALAQLASATGRTPVELAAVNQQLTKAGPDLKQALAAGKQQSSLFQPAVLQPMSTMPVASTNTGAVIAGLDKAGGREWVFRPGDEVDPDLKPLFGDARPTREALLAATAPQHTLFGGSDPESEAIAQMIGKTLAAGGKESRGDTTQAALGGLAQQRGLPQATGQMGVGALGGASTAQAGLSADPQLAQLARALSELKGSIDGVAARKTALKAGPATGDAAALGGGLSGGEFLTALTATRGERSGLDSGDQGTGNGGAGQQRPELRLLDGGQSIRAKSRFEDGLDLGTAGAGSAAAAHFARPASPGHLAPEGPIVVTGHVTQGAMAQDRLSSESLMGLSAGIRHLNLNGGGEIHLRLKPENLGEIHLKVVTQGTNVGLHIQASDEKAKTILQESLSHLKDSLAQQSLTLGTVDLSVARAGQAWDTGQDLSRQQQQQSQPQQGFGEQLGNAGQGRQQGREGWAGLERELQPEVRATSHAIPISTTRSASHAAEVGGARIDVRA